MNDNYDVNAIIERLTQLKDLHGGNAKAICIAAGISDTLYSDWKSGKAKPSLTSIVALSLYFDVPLEWIIFGDNTPEQKANTIIDDKEFALITKFRQLPEVYQDKLFAYLDGMLATIDLQENSGKQESLA